MIDVYNESFYTVILLTIGLLLGFIMGMSRKTRNEPWWGGINENTGESLVRHALKEYCYNKEAHLLNNITIRTEEGSTTQIDHILISTKGIFVIETKHYKGWIFGHPNHKEWTQITYKNRYTFQNPLFQNYKHVKEVQKILEFVDPQFIYNIVVFTGESTFKMPKINNVCNREELIPLIDKYAEGALSLNRVHFCVGRLEYMRMELSRRTDVEHQLYLNRKYG